jgi:hypothetical protein
MTGTLPPQATCAKLTCHNKLSDGHFCCPLGQRVVRKCGAGQASRNSISLPVLCFSSCLNYPTLSNICYPNINHAYEYYTRDRSQFAAH